MTVDMEMELHYAFSNWSSGFGDFHLVADLDAVLAAWLHGQYSCCDVERNADHHPVAVAPRRSCVANSTPRTMRLATPPRGEWLSLFCIATRIATHTTAVTPDFNQRAGTSRIHHLLQGARGVEDHVGAARRYFAETPEVLSRTRKARRRSAARTEHGYAIGLRWWIGIVDEAGKMKELKRSTGVSGHLHVQAAHLQSGSSCHIHLSSLVVRWRE
jgi:hypothetical protein